MRIITWNSPEAGIDQRLAEDRTGPDVLVLNSDHRAVSIELSFAR